MISNEDALRKIRGVSLHGTEKANLEQYNFFVSSIGNKPIFYDWLPLILRDDSKRLDLLSAALLYNSKFFMDLELDYCKETLDEWVSRYDKPSRIFEDVVLDEINDLNSLIKESVAGPHLLNLLNSKKIHPITFCYLSKLSGCTKKWTSIHWKIHKRKIETIEKVVDVKQEKVVKLMHFLKTRFGE